MPSFRLSEQNFCFSYLVPELTQFKLRGDEACQLNPLIFSSPSGTESFAPLSSTKSWIGGAQRLVEVYDSSAGMLLKVEGIGEFLVAPQGEAICKRGGPEDLTNLDQEIILGPALVLALALRGVWALHASAVMYQDKTIVLVGESGQGKSTLAAYLSRNSGWRLVADDILPTRLETDSVNVLPHFPQLKLPVEAQPGPGLPEHLPLTKVFVLTSAGQDTMPGLRYLPSTLAIQALLRHTAGTRMFTPEMLGKHLSFCSQVAGKVPVYELAYPHRRDTLPQIKEMLETLC